MSVASKFKVPLTQPLITFCEENFECEQGEPRAYMEFSRSGARAPVTPQDLVRVVYVVYAISGDEYGDLEAWMIDKVLMPLLKAGGVHLYWRPKEKIEATEIGSESEGNREWMLRTRIGVLDKDYRPVVIAEMVKPELEPCRRIEDE